MGDGLRVGRDVAGGGSGRHTRGIKSFFDITNRGSESFLCFEGNQGKGLEARTYKGRPLK